MPAGEQGIPPCCCPGSGSEPSISEPSISEPSLSEPSLSEPSLSEPSLSEPSLSEPSLSEPSLSEPSGSVSGSISGSVTEVPSGPSGPCSNDTCTVQWDGVTWQVIEQCPEYVDPDTGLIQICACSGNLPDGTFVGEIRTSTCYLDEGGGPSVP